MAIESTRMSEARAPSTSSSPTRGPEAGAGSFSAVLGGVDAHSNEAAHEAQAPEGETGDANAQGEGAQEASAPAHDARTEGRHDKGRPAKTGKPVAGVALPGAGEAEDTSKGVPPAATDAATDTTPAGALATLDPTDAASLAATISHLLGGATRQPAEGTPTRATTPGDTTVSLDAVGAAKGKTAARGFAGEAADPTQAKTLPGESRAARETATLANAGTADDTGKAQGAHARGAAVQADALSTAAQNQAAADAAAARAQNQTAPAADSRATMHQDMERLLSQARSDTAQPADADLMAELRNLRRTGSGVEGAGGGHATASGQGIADTAWNRHALTADAAQPVAQSGIDTTGASLEDRMSAQVTYWLSQKTQNAELSLDALGGRPVEVSIQLKGQEAQVAFRAEHASTRELLGSALPQLRELLGGQGVQLSGVSIDAFGASQAQSGGAGSQGEGGRFGRGGRQVAQVELPTVAAAGRATGASGRSLDLFV